MIERQSKEREREREEKKRKSNCAGRIEEREVQATVSWDRECGLFTLQRDAHTTQGE
jgi:hypothetical protein